LGNPKIWTLYFACNFWNKHGILLVLFKICPYRYKNNGYQVVLTLYFLSIQDITHWWQIPLNALYLASQIISVLDLQRGQTVFLCVCSCCILCSLVWRFY